MPALSDTPLSGGGVVCCAMLRPAGTKGFLSDSPTFPELPYLSPH